VRKNCYQQDQQCEVQFDDMLRSVGDIKVIRWCWYYSNINRKEVSKRSLILFSTLFAGYVSSLLFQIVLLLTKWRASFISIYNYLYIMSHVNLRLIFFPFSIKLLAFPYIYMLQNIILSLEITLRHVPHRICVYLIIEVNF